MSKNVLDEAMKLVNLDHGVHVFNIICGNMYKTLLFVKKACFKNSRICDDLSYELN